MSDRTVKHTRASEDGQAAHSPSKNQKQTLPQKSAGATRYRLRSTAETSPSVNERLRDGTPDSSKSTKTPTKKRSALKVNKAVKPRVSPYATRSLSPLVSFLRNGKGKRVDLRMIPKFKKRVIEDRDEQKPVVEDVKNVLKSRQSSDPESLPRLRKRTIPTYKIVPLGSKKCKPSPGTESDSGITSGKDEVNEETQDKVSGAVESLLGSSEVKQEFEESSVTQNSGDMFDMSIDKSSSCNNLSEFSESQYEGDNTSSTDNLVPKIDSNNSCDIVFDLDKCGSCLRPVIVDAKENLGLENKQTEGSEASLPEMLYLSDSSHSFEKVSETFNSENGIPKTDLEVDRCTLDDCSDILSIENSRSSLIVCSSSGRAVHNGVSLPPYEAEDVSVSVRVACDSLSMLDAEESMNEFMHEISSSKGRENTLDFADSSNDSNHIDATSILKTLEQAEPSSDELDTSSKDRELTAYGVPSKVEENEVMETVKNLAANNIVDIMKERLECNIGNQDLHENIKESSIDLSVYDDVPVDDLEEHESYSFNTGDNLQDLGGSLPVHDCKSVRSSDVQRNSSLSDSDHKPLEVSNGFSVCANELIGISKEPIKSNLHDEKRTVQVLDDCLSAHNSDPCSTLEEDGIGSLKSGHKDLELNENVRTHLSESLITTEEKDSADAMISNSESQEVNNSLPAVVTDTLSTLEEQRINSFNSKEKSEDFAEKSPIFGGVIISEEQSNSSSSNLSKVISENFEVTHDFINEYTDDHSNTAVKLEGSGLSDGKCTSDCNILRLSVGVGDFKKSPECQFSKDQPTQHVPISSVVASVSDGNVPSVTDPCTSQDSCVEEADVPNERHSDDEVNASNANLSALNEVSSVNTREESPRALDLPENSVIVEDESESMVGGIEKVRVTDESLGRHVRQADTLVHEETEVESKENATPPAVASSKSHVNVVDEVLNVEREEGGEKDAGEKGKSSEIREVNETFTKEVTNVEEDSAEQLAIKETILNALGLQSSRTASLAKSTVRQELPPIPSRTSGTLKTIIKVPKMADKRRARHPLKLSLEINKGIHDKEKECLHGRRSMDDQGEFSGPGALNQPGTQNPFSYGIFNESCISPSDSWDTHMSKHKSKSHGSGRKFHSGEHLSPLDPKYMPFSRNSLNGINQSSSLDWQSKSCQDIDQNVPSDGSSNSGRSSQQGSSEGSGEASLVIPEKSASFSIHPERLCLDVCCYCFGKFGSLDTPMHLAQMKGEEKRRTALALEANLSQDSCLCDACYRYLDRKASCPSYQPYRRQSGVSGGILTKPQVCCVRGCSLPAHHLVRRKWLTRLRRTISKLLPIELTPVPSHQQQPLHAPLCSRHFYCLEYYSLCGICKRKLSRNNMHPVGREVHALNSVLMEDAIPVTLTGKIFLCKMCRYYSGLRLKYRNKNMLSSGHKTFFDGYRKRIWHYLGIQTLDSSEISEPMEIPKKKKKSRPSEGDSSKNSDIAKLPRHEDRASNQTAEIISSESGSEMSTSKPSGSMPTKIRLKLGNVNIGQLDNVDLSRKESKGHSLPSGSHRGKSDSSKPKKKSSVDSAMNTSCFPGVEHLGLNASFVFHGNDGSDKNKEWEKCTTTIQFDSKTKKLWQNLYYPYGNFSSFIRHLVIMEKNWRNGDLILSPNASSQAVNYVNSVHNRIAAYEGSSSCESIKSVSSALSTMSSPSLLSSASSYKPVSSRPPVPVSISVACKPHMSASVSSNLNLPVSFSPASTSSVPFSSVTPLCASSSQMSSRPIVSSIVRPSKPSTVPQKTTKEPPFLPSASVVPRITSLPSTQISQHTQPLTAPVAAQLIPVNAAGTNFLPLTCGPSQFISFGSTSSFIQFGGATGFVHPINSPYSCVQFNHEMVPDKLAVGRELGNSRRDSSNVSNPSSSLREFELHISNVRSLADDVGGSSSWEQQPDKQSLSEGNACINDSLTQSSGRQEEQSLEVNSDDGTSSLPAGTLLSSDNHSNSDGAVGNTTHVELVESQENLFENV